MPRKKWSKPDKIYLPIILDDITLNTFLDIPKDNADNTYDADNADNRQKNIIINKISKWRLKTNKFTNISYNKLSKKKN